MVFGHGRLLMGFGKTILAPILRFKVTGYFAVQKIQFPARFGGLGQFFGKPVAALRGYSLMMNQRPQSAEMPGSNPDPASPDHAPVKSTTDARAGVTFGTMRWVLTISVIAVLVVFGLIWLGTHH
ncbi:MAG TPA: hypothetical protein VH722_20120 [Alphaproteobacteria bacterium]|nr:hypothetical protein [Alphaproteobacteria bacterium]